MVLLVWALTAPLPFGPLKRLSRFFSVIIFIIIFLILLLSDREDQYVDEGDKIENYDATIVPRIAVSSMMILSSIIALTFMTFIHFSKVIVVCNCGVSVTYPTTPSLLPLLFQGSSQDMDPTTLW